MEETSRFTGIGRLKTMREDIACWRMKLLASDDLALHREVPCKSARYEPQHTSIRGQTRNGDADVIIYPVHLLLVRCKFSRRTLIIL